MRIEAGATRLVFVGRKLVAKVPRPKDWYTFLAGLISNINEASIWREMKDERLCPTVFAMPGGWLNIMRRAEPYTEPTLPTWLVLSGITFDIDPSNVGWLDGRLVVIDYA